MPPYSIPPDAPARPSQPSARRPQLERIRPTHTPRQLVYLVGRVMAQDAEVISHLRDAGITVGDLRSLLMSETDR